MPDPENSSPENPTLKRKIVQGLEKAGMHGLLAFVGSKAAKKITGSDVGLFHDEIWVRRVGDACLGDKRQFDYYVDEFKSWNEQHRLWLEDPKEYWFYKYKPVRGDVVIDVGAGFGNDALIFAREVGRQGRVIAIEAHPMAYRKLQKTCKWSKLDNVTPLPVALGVEPGEMFITGDDDDPENTVVSDMPANEASFEIKVRPFDEIADELGVERIDLIKMNIEGAETGALKGMSRSLEMASNVIISCHDFRADRGDGEGYRTLEPVSEILRAAGFQLHRREDDPRPYIRDTLYGWR